MKCEENIIYTQKSLSQRYGISIAALQYWYPYAGIVKPKKRGGYFALDAVEIADLFYVATKIRRLTHEEYLEKVIPAGMLEDLLFNGTQETSTELEENQNKIYSRIDNDFFGKVNWGEEPHPSLAMQPQQLKSRHKTKSLPEKSSP